MKIRYGLLVLVSSLRIAGADADPSDRYRLPRSKVHIEACQREALRLHPGSIERLRLLNRHGNFWMRYEIRTPDVSEWSVVCDLATGGIINEQKLVDDAS